MFKKLILGISKIWSLNISTEDRIMTFMNIKRLCLIAAFVLFGVNESHAQLKIVYIRHAEGGHNVRQNWETYSNINEEKWPIWVGDHTIFTPTGRGELTRVAGKLKRYKFDFIAASSAWRSRNTILPYMKEVGAKGEVWPELAEIYQSELIISHHLPKPTVKILGAGDPIEIPSEEAPYFTLRKDGLNEFKKAKFPRDHSEKEAETGMSQVVIQRVLDMITERFGGTDATILLAGHGSSGKGILRMLTNEPLLDLPGIVSSGVWMVEEQADGKFKLKIFNDVPIDKYCE